MIVKNEIELSADSLLHTKASNNSAGDLYTGIGPGNAPGMTIQNSGTTDSNHATIFFKNDSGHRAHIGAKFVNHSTEQTDLTFGVTDASGNARERLHLKANTNNGADFIGYEGPNATSSTAGDNWHLVADRAMEVKQDNNNASSWIAMKTFTLGANCKSLSIKLKNEPETNVRPISLSAFILLASHICDRLYLVKMG